MSSILGSIHQPYESMQDRGINILKNNVQEPDLALPETIASKTSYTPQDSNLTKASVIGTGVDTAMQLAGGIAQGVQTKRLREKAEAESMAELAQARIDREKELDLMQQQDNFSKQQAREQSRMADIGLRMQMFQRDMQKQAQKFQDAQSAYSRIRQSGVNTDMIKDIFARNVGRMG